jgi:hypothetical protein
VTLPRGCNWRRGSQLPISDLNPEQVLEVYECKPSYPHLSLPLSLSLSLSLTPHTHTHTHTGDPGRDSLGLSHSSFRLLENPQGSSCGRGCRDTEIKALAEQVKSTVRTTLLPPLSHGHGQKPISGGTGQGQQPVCVLSPGESRMDLETGTQQLLGWRKDRFSHTWMPSKEDSCRRGRVSMPAFRITEVGGVQWVTPVHPGHSLRPYPWVAVVGLGEGGRAEGPILALVQLIARVDCPVARICRRSSSGAPWCRLVAI